MTLDIFCLIVGLILGCVISFCFLSFLLHKKENPNKLRVSLNHEQEKLVKELKLKKNAREKEIADEEQEIQNQLQKKKDSLQLEYEQLKQKLAEDFETEEQHKKQLLEDVEKNYQSQLHQLNETLQKQHLEEQQRRNKEWEETIRNETENHQREILKLQEDFKSQTDRIEKSFLAYSEQINLKKESLQNEIDSYKNKQEQIIARFKQDEETRKERDYYRINVNETAEHDIKKLRQLAEGFNNPNVIYRIIWEEYYKAKMEALFKKLLGPNIDKGGIYKITNILNEKIYIGRAVNIKERWRTHAKRGCGIDQVKSLLYDAMMKDGLQSFTFEVLEFCPKEEQGEKEKQWIDFYHSDVWGYNQNKGG